MTGRLASLCVVACLLSAAHPVTGGAQQRGRYKIEGGNCVWNGDDSGTNQCTPRIEGRFRNGPNNSCTWDTNDAGPDQCRPPKGRWKLGANNRCGWDASDDGPDQCNPRQPR